jgi:hypothetical protein
MRASIVGAVTVQRLKWGAGIQDLVGSFCGAAYYCRFSADKNGDEERKKKIEEIGQLRHLIPLNLCERTPIELEVEKLVEKIFSMSCGSSPGPDEDFRATLLKLVQKTKDLLRDNWQSAVREAERGTLDAPPW